MDRILILRNQWGVLSSRWPRWSGVLLFLVLSRAALNVPVLIGSNCFSLAEGVVGRVIDIDPYSLPGTWARWDAGYYLGIAQNGYSLHGEELAFFPLYPLLIRLLAFGSPALMVWSGFLISNLSFILAALLLWHQVALEFDDTVAQGTILALGLFPTSLFFSAIYTESLFLLFSVLVYWFSVREKYVVAGLFVTAASLTRVNGVLLAVIPLAEIVLRRPPRWGKRVVAAGFVSGVGVGFYGLYLWITQVSPFAFFLAQSNWERTITWPWKTILDSLAVVVSGNGGMQGDWFVRVISAEDLLASLLFIVCTILAFFLIRKSLFAYACVVMFVLLISHGPYNLGLWSMSRYVLGIFPGFIVLGILFSRARRLKWGFSAIGALVLLFLTGWFASGRWVA